MIRALAAALLLGTIANAQTYESVTANAVLHWQMQDNAATNFVASLAGPAGALSNGTTAQVHTTGPVGPLPGAFNLQGTGWHPQISVANMIEGTNELTVGIWVKLPAYPSGYEPILALGADLANVELQAGPDGRLRVNFESAGVSSNTSTAGVLSVGAWHHVVATFDMYQVSQEGDAEVTINAYVDNTEVISATEDSYPTLTHTGNGKIAIGAARSGGARGNGHYCDVTIFLDVLAQQERAALATGSGAPLSTPPNNRGADGWHVQFQGVGILTEVSPIVAQNWAGLVQSTNGHYVATGVGNGNVTNELNDWKAATTNDDGVARFGVEHEGVVRYFETTSPSITQLFLPPVDEFDRWAPFDTALQQEPPGQPPARPASGLVNNTIANVIPTEVGEGEWGYTHEDLPNGWRVHFRPGQTTTPDVDGWHRVEQADGDNIRLSYVHEGERLYFEIVDNSDGQAHGVYLPPAGETPYWSPWQELINYEPGPPPSRPPSGMLDNTIANMNEVRQSVADSWGTLPHAIGDVGNHRNTNEDLFTYTDGWTATRTIAGVTEHRVSVEHQGITRYFQLDEPTNTNSTLFFPPAAELDQYEPWATLLAQEPPSPCEPSAGDCDGDCIPNGADASSGCDGSDVPEFDTYPQGPGNTTPTGDNDDDGDGIPNSSDPDQKCQDSDGDGIPNILDDDDDNDGIRDGLDLDPDGDGLRSEDDPDDDGDCLRDVEDPDQDGDGVPDFRDGDLDGDGLMNSIDIDMDGDGIPNDQDRDNDSDGQIDSYFPPELRSVRGSISGFQAMNDNIVNREYAPPDQQVQALSSDPSLDPRVRYTRGTTTETWERSEDNDYFQLVKEWSHPNWEEPYPAIAAFTTRVQRVEFFHNDHTIERNTWFVEVVPNLIHVDPSTGVRYEGGCEGAPCNEGWEDHDCRADGVGDPWSCIIAQMALQVDQLCAKLEESMGPECEEAGGQFSRGIELRRGGQYDWAPMYASCGCFQSFIIEDCDNDGIDDAYDEDVSRCLLASGIPPDEDDQCQFRCDDRCEDNPCLNGCPDAESLACGYDDCVGEGVGGSCDGDGDPEEEPCQFDYDSDGICDECDVDCPDRHCEHPEDWLGNDIICDDNNGNGKCDKCEEDCVTRLIGRLWIFFRLVNISPACEEFVAETAPLQSNNNGTGITAPAFTLRVDTCFNDVGVIGAAREQLRGILSWLVSFYFLFWYFRLLWGL